MADYRPPTGFHFRVEFLDIQTVDNDVLFQSLGALFGIDVMDRTLTATQGLRVALLPRWYDVDVYADLLRLHEELRSLPPGRARHTRNFLAQSGIV